MVSVVVFDMPLSDQMCDFGDYESEGMQEGLKTEVNSVASYAYEWRIELKRTGQHAPCNSGPSAI